MFTVDIPYVPIQEAPTVLAQAAVPGAGNKTPAGSPLKPDYLLKACTEVNNDGEPLTAMNAIDPGGYLLGFVMDQEKRYIAPESFSFSVSILKGPIHGKLITKTSASGYVAYMYQPDPGFLPKGDYIANPALLAKDQSTFLVIYAGKTYKVIVDIHVFLGVDENSPTCPQPQLIKLKSKPAGGSSGLDGSGVTINIASLPSGTLAQTSGPTITLSPTAAGHGWFIDRTPTESEEFLPTSNPNEWVAKPGSEAEGKMDMLTILLHEYGHVLGIDHTADTHDFMATTLQPGMRRTLSVDQQLELMQLAGYFPTPDSPSEPCHPTDPGAPLPFTRTTTNRFGRMRPNFGKGKTEFDTLANPKLENPTFENDTAWATQGDVTFANGSATLTNKRVASRFPRFP